MATTDHGTKAQIKHQEWQPGQQVRKKPDLWPRPSPARNRRITPSRVRYADAFGKIWRSFGAPQMEMPPVPEAAVIDQKIHQAQPQALAAQMVAGS